MVPSSRVTVPAMPGALLLVCLRASGFLSTTELSACTQGPRSVGGWAGTNPELSQQARPLLDTEREGEMRPPAPMLAGSTDSGVGQI